ncbi:MAG: folate-binding protein, partial [Enterovirga sp.]|nr:folate-binding protein [Enterovirga sp.]
MPVAHLSDRSVVKVGGAEARDFLDRLITCDLDRIGPGGARFGALLTPQGKILADFIAFDGSALDFGSYFLDIPASCAQELTKRLSMYKLRAKVAVEDLSATFLVLAGWGDTAMPAGGRRLAAADPRLPALGWRAIVARDGLAEAGVPDGGEAAYHAHRVALGVPEGGRDFAFADAFP